jgi:hypothetical protein
MTTQISIRQTSVGWIMALAFSFRAEVHLTSLTQGEALAEEFAKETADLTKKWREVSIEVE